MVEKYYNVGPNSIRLLWVENDDNPVNYLYAYNKDGNIWEIKTVVSENGNAYKLYEDLMDIIYPGFIIPYRGETINLKLKNIYSKFIEREDIEDISIEEDSKDYRNLPEHNNWYNRKYKLKEKFRPEINIPKGYTFMNYIYIHGIGLKYFLSKNK